MTLILSGTNGLSDVDGSAATPAIRGTDTNTGIFFPAADTIGFAEGGAEVARFDSSGNFGLGVTPSAWGSIYKALQLTDGAAFVEGGGNTYVGNNWYNNGSSGIYIANGAAAVYGQSGGQHQWFNAPSGTAGNIATFTQAMTLDAAGSLAIANTSPSSYQSVARQLVVGATGSNGITVVSGTTGTGNLFFADGTTGADGYQGYLQYDHSTNSLNFGTTALERARIDASGRLLLGTTSAYYAASGRGEINLNASSDNIFGFLIGGNPYAYIYTSSSEFRLANTASIPTTFYINGTERARITSGGQLLIGTTTAGAGIGFTTKVAIDASGDFGMVVKTSNAAYECINTWNSATSGTRYHMYFRDGASASARGSITTDGANTAYNTSSDYRLKDNPQPLTGSGAFIDALKPKTWIWKETGATGVGFIAHEVQEVSPGSVTGIKDAVDEKGNPIMQGMEYGSAEFIANIIAELQALRQRVAALESGAK